MITNNKSDGDTSFDKDKYQDNMNKCTNFSFSPSLNRPTKI